MLTRLLLASILFLTQVAPAWALQPFMLGGGKYKGLTLYATGNAGYYTGLTGACSDVVSDDGSFVTTAGTGTKTCELSDTAYTGAITSITVHVLESTAGGTPGDTYTIKISDSSGNTQSSGTITPTQAETDISYTFSVCPNGGALSLACINGTQAGIALVTNLSYDTQIDRVWLVINP